MSSSFNAMNTKALINRASAATLTVYPASFLTNVICFCLLFLLPFLLPLVLPSVHSAAGPYEWKTPAANLRKGMVSHGDPSRLREVMDRWKSGSFLKLGFLGGSVTEGGYCYDSRVHPFGVPYSWPQWTEIVLRENLRGFSGGGNITIMNGAISATSSDYFSLCHPLRLPPDVDVIFLEMAVNDLKDPRYRTGGVVSKQHKSFERLVRSCLKYPNHPAVIVLNQFDFYKGCNTTRGMGGTFEEAWLRVGLDDLYTNIARWYDVSAISVRSAVFDLMQRGVDGFKLDRPVIAGHCYDEYRRLHNESDLWKPDVTLHSFYRDDAPHPGCMSGARVLGELAASVLLTAFDSLKSQPVGLDEKTSHLPPLTHLDLPPPIYDKNYDLEGNRSCLFGRAIEGLMVKADGWNFTDEGRRKWGWIATTVGSKLDIKVPATTAHHSQRGRNQSTLVGVDIDFLASYEKMGMARVECASGCSCGPITIDASHHQHISANDAITIAVTESLECVLRFTITNVSKSRDKGNKFKITGITILPEILEGAVGQRIFTHGDSLVNN